MLIKGVAYRTADNWRSIIPLPAEPINYLEIGVFFGANIITVAETYGLNPASKMYAVDPWIDYDDYPEYRTAQNMIYDTFVSNLALNNVQEKVIIKRGFSHEVVPTLPDNFFDIIYIDGNHEPEYVLEDAVVSFRKLKIGGYLIFDDYNWTGPDLTTRGIDGFLNGYYKRIAILNDYKNNDKESQVFVRKLR